MKIRDGNKAVSNDLYSKVSVLQWRSDPYLADPLLLFPSAARKRFHHLKIVLQWRMSLRGTFETLPTSSIPTRHILSKIVYCAAMIYINSTEKVGFQLLRPICYYSIRCAPGNIIVGFNPTNIASSSLAVFFWNVFVRRFEMFRCCAFLATSIHACSCYSFPVIIHV